MNTLPLSAAVLALACSLPCPAALKVGMVLKGNTPFWNEVAAGAQAAASEAKLDLALKLPPTEESVSIQVQMINSLSHAGLDVLIVAPDDPDYVKPAIAKFSEAGTRVVMIEAPLADDRWSTTVGLDQGAAGAEAGRLLAALANDGDSVCVFRASLSNTAARQRESSALTTLVAARPGVITHGDIFSGSEPELALERARALVAKYPYSKAVFASTTTGTLAMLQALQEANLAGSIKLIGFGFNLPPSIIAALRQGTMRGWLAQIPREIGASSVKAAAALLHAEAVPAATRTKFVVVTKENLDEPAVQALAGR